MTLCIKNMKACQFPEVFLLAHCQSDLSEFLSMLAVMVLFDILIANLPSFLMFNLNDLNSSRACHKTYRLSYEWVKRIFKTTS